jgi:hypothetical protein
MRHKLLVSMAALAIGIAVASCGENEEPASKHSGSTAPQAQQTPSAQAERSGAEKQPKQSSPAVCSTDLSQSLSSRSSSDGLSDLELAELGLSTDLSQSLSSRSSSDGLSDLELAELGLPTEPNSPGLCSLTSFISSSSNEMPLKLCQPSKHSNHKLAMWRCGIGPSISERAELSAPSATVVEDVKQVSS